MGGDVVADRTVAGLGFDRTGGGFAARGGCNCTDPAERVPRRAGQRGDGTAVGAALIHAAAAFDAGPACTERTVDVSGDGVNRQGIAPRIVLDSLYDGITVNALVIHEPVDDPMLDRQYGGDTPLLTWFNEMVLHGPGKSPSGPTDMRITRMR